MNNRSIPQKWCQSYHPCYEVRITTGIEEGAESTERYTCEPNVPVSYRLSREEHVAMKLVENRAVRIVAIVCVNGENIHRPIRLSDQA
jgi:hypothetical protein